MLREVISYWRSGEPVGSDGDLEIHHIDVGQADSTLVVAPSGETMLIDSGYWRQDGSGVIAYLEEQGITRIDHLVTTHAHADHIGGHAEVINHFETNGDGVGAVYDPGVPATSQTYEDYLTAIDEHNVDLYEVAEGDSIAFGDATVQFLNPPENKSNDDLNDNSLAFTIEYGETTYLTTGDAEAAVEERMVAKWGDQLDADIYQAGHHGSSTSSTQPFIDIVDPKTAVISSGYDSQYDHPHDEVLQRFGEMALVRWLW
ncbi:MBL fold protein [Natrinema sp. CBA1119]|nr:MBL fold protein [Natrinema sp. CBA1119]PGF14439.1 MBL fold protein [Natrinema sp. CBA1119]